MFERNRNNEQFSVVSLKHPACRLEPVSPRLRHSPDWRGLAKIDNPGNDEGGERLARV